MAIDQCMLCMVLSKNTNKPENSPCIPHNNVERQNGTRYCASKFLLLAYLKNKIKKCQQSLNKT